MSDLLKRIQDRSAVVGVIGLGYVGLPLAVQLAEAGCTVLGFDVDPTKIERLTAGDSYIGAVSNERLQALLESQKFACTADLGRLGEPDALLIAVPTPITAQREPDLRYVEATAESIAKTLRPGQLVVLESTTYPGTTDEVVRPILERGGLKVGTDIHLAYSPEREDPGNMEHGLGRIPKVVGADDPASREFAAALYRLAVPEVIEASSSRAAEACKVLENIYRAVNIAMVNEMKILFERMGIDVWEVVDLASTKPFGFQRFDPGPGFGGHCIPCDPFYLSWKAREYGTAMRFIELAGEINDKMARYVTTRVVDSLNEQGKALKGAQILLLGIAYKRDVGDCRESPAFPLAVQLQKRGAVLRFHDPFVEGMPDLRHYPDLDLPRVTELTPQVLGEQDVVLIVTDHTSVDYSTVVAHSALVVDTRNATRTCRDGRDNVVMA